MKAFFVKRKSWILRLIIPVLVISVTSIVSIAKLNANDPFDHEMTLLEKSVDRVLLDPNTNFDVKPDGNYKSGSILGYLKYRGAFKKDRAFAYNAKDFQELLLLVDSKKILIEQEASKREYTLNMELTKRSAEILAKNDIKVSESLIDAERARLQNDIYGKFGSIVARYYQIQKRLVENQIKNAHFLKDMNLFRSDLLDKFNLKLNLAVGGYVASHSDFGLFYNMWHTLNPSNQLFDLIEVGLTPQDKSNMEQAVLEEKKSEYGFSKLIHLLATRERIINQWATERLSKSATILTPPNLVGCAAPDLQKSGLVSFNDQPASPQYSQGNYYDYLWKKDRFDEFVGTYSENSISSLVAPKTFGRPVLTKSQLEVLLFSFFDLVKTKSDQKSLATVSDIPCEENAKGLEVCVDDPAAPKKLTLSEILAGVRAENKIPSTKEAYQDFLNSLVGDIEAKWKEKSTAALMDANFMADRWDNESVASRIALYGYQFRKKYIAQVLFFQAQSLGKISNNLTAEEYAPIFQKAVSRVDEFLAPTKNAWLKSQREAVLAVLKSEAAKQIRLETKDFRLAAKVESQSVAITNGAKAIYADHKIEQLTKANLANGSWKSKGLSTYEKEYELGYIGALNRLKDKRINAWLPDQLTQFFFAKLRYWKENAPNSQVYLPKLAREIEENKQVMQGVYIFFTVLNNNFMAELQDRKLTPEMLGPNQTPLYDVLRKSTLEAYQQFVASIKENPTATNIAPPQSKLFPSDHIDQSLSINKTQYDFKNYVPVNERQKTIELFVQAMSLLNMGKYISTTDGSDSYSAIANKLFYFPKNVPQQKLRTVQAKTFLQIEGILAQDNLSVEKPALLLTDRIFGSLLDQRILAKILQEEVIKKYPIQAIQYGSNGNWLNNPDLNAETVFDLAALSYTPEKGLPNSAIKNSMSLGLDRATKIIPGLIVEACNAKPRVHDEPNFQKIYKASRALRRSYTELSTDLQKVDDKLVEFTQTPIERKEARFTKIVGITFAIFMICMAVYFLSLAPVLLNFTTTSLFGIAEGFAGLSKVMILPFLSMKGMFSLLNLFVMTGVFAYQVALQYQVGCIELPNQLKYQLNVSNSQVNDYGRIQVARKDLDWLNSNINSTYLNVQIGAIMQIAFIGQIAPQLKAMTGSLGLKAIRELEIVEPILAKNMQAVRMEALKATTLSEMMATEGRVTGALKFIQTKTKELLVDGQFRVLSEKATFAELQKAINVRYASIFKKTANLEEVFKLRNEAIQLRAQKLARALEANAAIKARIANLPTRNEFVWQEIGYNIRNFFDRYISVANVNKRKFFRAAMDNEVLKAADDVAEVFWNPETRTFRMSAKNAGVESAQRIVIDQKTAAEVAELMKIAEMNELAKEYMVNQRLIAFVQEARGRATEFVKTEQKIALAEESVGAGTSKTTPADFVTDHEQAALEAFFDLVSESNNWQYVQPVFKWASEQGGIPSPFVLSLRETMKSEAILQSELHWTKFPEMKAAQSAQEAAEKVKTKTEKEEAATVAKEEKRFDQYEEVFEGPIYEFEITTDGIKIVPPKGAFHAPDGSWYFGGQK